jgi:phage repressor protein C with HTH and peptisase S24 domain
MGQPTEIAPYSGENGITMADDTVPNEKSVDPKLAERLRIAVARVGNASAASRLSGVPVSTLNNYLAGRDMKRGPMVALADATNVSLEWLATGRGEMVAGAAAAPTAQPIANPALGSSFVLIPRYDVRASAGAGQAVEQEQQVGYMAFEQDFARTVLRRPTQHLVTLRAEGDSMEPTIRDGDVLVVDTSVTEVENSRVYIVDVNGRLMVKRIQLRLDGSLVIKSDNPKYEPEVVHFSECTPFRIVGQVIYQAGPVRS